MQKRSTGFGWLLIEQCLANLLIVVQLVVDRTVCATLLICCISDVSLTINKEKTQVLRLVVPLEVAEYICRPRTAIT